MYKVIKRDCPVFGNGPYTCEFICDTASDISTLPTSISEGTGGKSAYDNQKCASGSIATVVDNGAESKRYIMNNQNVWCPNDIGTGSSYELPIATTEILGGVMVDGTSITANEQGVISAVGSGGGLEFIGEYYVSSTTGLTTIISKADYKEGDIYLILVRSDSSYPWAYGIYPLIALPTSPITYRLYCAPSHGTGDFQVSIRLDSAGLSVSDEAYYKFYKMKVG